MDLRRRSGISRSGHMQNSEHHYDRLQAVRSAPPLAIPRDALEAGQAGLSQASDEAMTALPAAELHRRVSHAPAKARHSAPRSAFAGRG